jgi:Uma2 family endonuclease
MYAYPDVVAVCGKPEYDAGDANTLTNPTVIIEVLSPSTEAYDRGARFAHYRQLETLQEYLLVAQNEARIDRYVRRGGEWVLTETTDLGGEVELPTIGCRLALREVYDKVEFKPAPDRTPQTQSGSESV